MLAGTRTYPELLCAAILCMAFESHEWTQGSTATYGHRTKGNSEWEEPDCGPLLAFSSRNSNFHPFLWPCLLRFAFGFGHFWFGLPWCLGTLWSFHLYSVTCSQDSLFLLTNLSCIYLPHFLLLLPFYFSSVNLFHISHSDWSHHPCFCTLTSNLNIGLQIPVLSLKERLLYNRPL